MEIPNATKQRPEEVSPSQKDAKPTFSVDTSSLKVAKGPTLRGGGLGFRV